MTLPILKNDYLKISPPYQAACYECVRLPWLGLAPLDKPTHSS